MIRYGTWHERKRERSMQYWRRWGVKLVTCGACSGSGHYDHNESPECGGCDGTGRTRMKLRSTESALASIRTLETMKRNNIEIRRALREGRAPVLEAVEMMATEHR